MATLAAIRTGVKTTLEAAIATVKVYDQITSVTMIPHGGCAVVVVPASADFLVAMGRGTDTWTFDLLLMVEPTDDEFAQTQLDGYVSGAGSLSIRQALFNTALGLTGTNAHITAMSDYNARHESAGLEHIGAKLALTVHTPGTA